MTLERLKQIVDFAIEQKEQNKDLIVCIPNNKPSMGQISVTHIKNAHRGIDWDKDKFLLFPEKQMVESDREVHGLDRVGKKQENKLFEFELPKDFKREYFKGRADQEIELQQLAQSQLSDGWIAENYFGSQDSFFTKDGKKYARVTIRRWI